MKKIYLLFGFIFAISAHVSAQLAVTPGVAPATLVNTILGAGVTVSNITVNGAPASSRGTFTCGAGCNIGFSNGIVLTSGSAAIAGAPNTGTGQGADIGYGGDPQLTTLTTGTTLDASVLEFDFMVASDSVAFNYIFGSDEYSDYVGSQFNDVFGFFISGPGIVGTRNIAIIPGTSTSVAINNVNNGFSLGSPSGPCTNCAYFRDNVSNAYTTAYDGLTTILTAGSLVQPCATYHIKLAISDVGDHVFDSGVFLEGNSFSSFGSVHILANGVSYSSGSTIYACNGSSITLSVNPAQNYNWNTGATTQSIVVNQGNIVPGGNYSFFTALGGCLAFTAIHVVFVTPTATITPLGPTALCPGSTVTLQANPGNSYLWSTGATTQSITVGTANTYTVTVSFNGGCSVASLPVQVTVGNATASISGTTSLCNGANTILTANLGQSYLWSNGQTTQSITVATANTYTVTVTQAGACTASASATVNVNPNPVPVITGITSVCQGASASLNAGPGYTNYLWSTLAVSQTITPSIAGTYTVTVTNGNGCTGSTAANVAVNPLPVPAIAGNTSFCQGSSSILNAGAGYTTYLWSTTATTQSITASTAGIYAVTVTNGFTCSASTSVNIVVNPNPVPAIAGATTFCQGGFTIFDAGAGYSNYLWSNAASTQTINPATAGIFTVTVTNANGCTGSVSKTTVVNPLPVPNITGTTSICQGATTSFNAGPGYSVYAWSTGVWGQTLNTGTAGTYTVTVTDANGCTGSDNINLTVNPLPVPVITGNNTFCQGASSVLNAGGGFTNYLWNTTSTTQTLNVSTSGNYTVTVTNAFTCTASTSQNVVVNALPVPVITGTSSICQGNFTVFNAGAGYANYAWSNAATTQTINISNAGIFTVTVTNVNGCTGSASKTTVVNPLPVPNITGNTSICQGALTTFNAGPSFNSYVWSTGGAGPVMNIGIAGTYTVTVTDANGCTGSDNINLTVNPIPAPSITGNNEFCQGNSSILNAGAGFASYLWSNNAITPTINVTASGNYIVTVTNGFSCSASTNKVVTVHPLPAPAITGGTGICQGTFTILNVGNNYSGYAWSTGATTQTINASTAGNFTVTVTDIFGCTNTASTTMVINPLPTPAITGNTSICQGTSSQFNAGAGYNSYIWSTGGAGQFLNNGTAGTYTVTVTDANGCTGSDNINLTVNPLPAPVITGDNEFCQGASSNLDAGAGFSSYLWSNSSSAQIINVNTSGNYSVIVTNGFNCSASTSKVVTVHALPTPAITGGTGICTGSFATLNAGNGYANYIWSSGGSTQTISVTSGGNYTVTVTDNNGCVSSTSTTMVVNPLPTPVITGNTAICQGATTQFNAGTGYNSYVWSTGGAGQFMNNGTAGTYTVTVTDANGCTGSDNISLVVSALPTPTITGNTVLCQNDNTVLNAGAGYTSYVWSNSSTAQTINTGTAGIYSVTVHDGNGCSASTSVNVIVHALPSPVITGLSPICQGNNTVLSGGNYTSFVWSTGATSQTINTSAAGSYTVTVTDNNGCVNSSPAFTLVVNALPSAVVGPNSAICTGGSSSFTISFTGAAPFHYIYNDGIQNSPLLTSPTASVTINVSPTATTTYTLVGISDLHCTGTFTGSAMVTVNPLPIPAITGNNTICDGTSATFDAGSYSGFSWSTGQTTQNISVNAAGPYTVTVTDGNGCVSSTSQTLIVNQTPVAAFTNDTSLTCAEPIIHFFDNSVYPAGSSFVWDFGDGAQSTEQNPAHTYTNPGTYPINLIVTSQFGCTGTVTQNTEIQFFPLPVAEFKADHATASVFNSNVNLIDLSQNAVTWNWNFGDGATASEQNPKHNYDDIGKFKILLTVTNIAGCISRYEQDILITPFFVPNSFTPNGDGLNDEFFNPGYVMDVAGYSMTIWNRWGEKMFDVDNAKETWNGYDKKGNVVPQGSYVYQISVLTKSNKKYSYQGSVMVIR